MTTAPVCKPRRMVVRLKMVPEVRLALLVRLRQSRRLRRLVLPVRWLLLVPLGRLVLWVREGLPGQ